MYDVGFGWIRNGDCKDVMRFKSEIPSKKYSNFICVVNTFIVNVVILIKYVEKDNSITQSMKVSIMYKS